MIEITAEEDWDVEDLIPLAEFNRRDQRQERFEQVWDQGRNAGPANIPEKKISSVNPRAQRDQPIDFFRDLFEDELIDILVTQTNNYAIQSNSLFWIPTTHQELEAFIGIIIYMTLHPQHDVTLARFILSKSYDKHEVQKVVARPTHK